MKKLKDYILVIFFALFVVISLLFNFTPGKAIFDNFSTFSYSVIKFLPTVFILIGIFEVWIERETIEKHLGENSSFISYLWAVLLAGTSVGGLYVALPVAKTLHDKGAKLSIVFTFLGAASVGRIPMMLFEASYLGIKFTSIRLLSSIPIIIFSSILIEKLAKEEEFPELSR